MKDYKKAKVGVILGGSSSEREVSLKSGRPMAAALRSSGYQVVEIDAPNRNVAALLLAEGIDVALIALHGTYGEDGCIQGLLEMLKIPYTGAGITASAVSMDKELSKRLFREAGLPTPPWHTFGRGEEPCRHHPQVTALGLPVVTKPVQEGSSVGITIAKTIPDLERGLSEAVRWGDHRVMVERYICGAEVTVGVLDGQVLGTTEIVPALEFYNYDTKYLRDDTCYHTPARVSPKTDRQLQEVAVEVVKLMNITGACRVDFIVDGDDNPWLLEVNTLPGMTDHSLLPMCAAQAGLSYAQLVERILQSARLHLGEHRYAHEETADPTPAPSTSITSEN